MDFWWGARVRSHGGSGLGCHQPALGMCARVVGLSIDGLAQSLKAMPSHEEKPATIRPTPRLDTQKPLLNHIKPSKSSIEKAI